MVLGADAIARVAEKDPGGKSPFDSAIEDSDATPQEFKARWRRPKRKARP
jgi:hypothetical protein